MSKPQTSGVVFNATTWALTQLSSSVPSSDAWMKARDLLGRRPRGDDEERLFDALVVSLTKQAIVEAKVGDMFSREMFDAAEEERDDALCDKSKAEDALYTAKRKHAGELANVCADLDEVKRKLAHAEHALETALSKAPPVAAAKPRTKKAPR